MGSRKCARVASSSTPHRKNRSVVCDFTTQNYRPYFLWHYRDFCCVCKHWATVCGASEWRWTILLVPTRKMGRRAICQMKQCRYWNFFDDRIISKNLWPPQSPDLTPPDFFLWVYLKETVYKNSPCTLVDLKRNTEGVKKIPSETLLRVSQNMCQWVNLCIQENGGHFQHLLWKSLSQVY
jgi:hypothetical protein